MYLKEEPHKVFKEVAILIYVFPVDSEGKEFETDCNKYQEIIAALGKYSSNAEIFVLIHKMDKVKEVDREKIFMEKKTMIEEVTTKENMSVREFFSTSIWLQSLFNAWSVIVQYLIPSLNSLREDLKKFSETCECEEVILFEKSTFLVISSYEKNPSASGTNKYERISNIIKQFNLSSMYFR